jgi:hypothetical protein
MNRLADATARLTVAQAENTAAQAFEDAVHECTFCERGECARCTDRRCTCCYGNED